MKFLFTSDLHGDEDHYVRLIDVAEDRRPDLIVLGGDMLPDDSALEPSRMGFGQPDFVRHRFKDLLTDLRKKSGCRAILFIFGNHDWASSVVAMEELAAEDLVNLLDLIHPVEIDGVNFLGYPCTPPTPWFVKDFERLDQQADKPPLLGGARWDPRFSRATTQGAPVLFESRTTIAEELSALKPPPDPWVFVVHAPPYESNLDRTYGREPWGSRAVRAAIEKHQPLLSLHGHVHESPAVTGEFRDQIGRTLAVNAGQTRSRLNYAVIEIDVAGRKVSQAEQGQYPSPL